MKMINYLKKTCIKASKAILEIYETDFGIEYKSDNSPLTLADKKANTIIVKSLKNKYPEIAILSEESMDDKTRLDKDYCFIIDPIDGTREFVKKNGEFSVNIGLVYKKRPILGVIYIPVSDDFYYAKKNCGAFLENVKTGKIKKIRVSDRENNIILLKSKSHSAKKEQDIIEKNQDKISKIISVGSSLKGCLIADGKADVYYRYGYTSEWDTCAMQCIVEESGGIFRQMDGSEMLYNRQNSLNEKGFYIVNNKSNIWL